MVQPPPDELDEELDDEEELDDPPELVLLELDVVPLLELEELDVAASVASSKPRLELEEHAPTAPMPSAERAERTTARPGSPRMVHLDGATLRARKPAGSLARLPLSATRNPRDFNEVRAGGRGCAEVRYPGRDVFPRPHFPLGGVGGRCAPHDQNYERSVRSRSVRVKTMRRRPGPA